MLSCQLADKRSYLLRRHVSCLIFTAAVPSGGYRRKSGIGENGRLRWKEVGLAHPCRYHTEATTIPYREITILCHLSRARQASAFTARGCILFAPNKRTVMSATPASPGTAQPSTELHERLIERDQVLNERYRVATMLGSGRWSQTYLAADLQ